MTPNIPPPRHKITTLTVTNQQQTEQVAQNMASQLQGGDVVALWGDVGAGKSTLARAIIHALCGANTNVPSPTFTLVQTYDTGQGFDIWHMDMYRLNAPEEAHELGIEEAFATECCLIEWPDKLGYILPKNRIDIMIEQDLKQGHNHRTITLYAYDRNHPLCQYDFV